MFVLNTVPTIFICDSSNGGSKSCVEFLAGECAVVVVVVIEESVGREAQWRTTYFYELGTRLLCS